jgi:DNA end-binding protein Ku
MTIDRFEPRGDGLLGTLLRYPCEVREPAEYFDDIPKPYITQDMLDLVKHIVQTKSSHFHPEKFEDRYELALRELLKRKQSGESIETKHRKEPTRVINLMDALRKSIETDRSASGSHASRPASSDRPGKKTSPSRYRKAS